MAVPGLPAAHHTPDGPDWAQMPVIRFNAKDDLQHRLLRRVAGGRAVPEWNPPEHHVPAADGYREAVLAGLGWGLLPERQAERDVAAARLVDLGQPLLELPLYWQVWSLHTDRLRSLTAEVLAAARVGLAPPHGGAPGIAGARRRPPTGQTTDNKTPGGRA